MTAQNKPSVDDRCQAQELAFEAMEAGDPAQRQSLCDQALKLDPNCVDALLLSDQVPDDPAKRIAYLEQVVRIAYDELGGEAFVNENRGYFWGLVETKPYMRARSYMAREYLEEHRTVEAIAEYEALLDLNPNDNQGLRYWLLGTYLEQGDLARARALFRDYDEATAVFAWGQVLERFVAGDLAGAERALATARQVNQHVETYATGRQKLPERLPEYYGDGDEREAQFCCFVLVAAWFAHEEFLDWLASQPQKKTHVSVDEAGRNDPCPCGSGKKYKKCCYGKPVDAAPDLVDSPQFPTVQHTAPGNTSAISESFFHGFRQFIGDREFESEEELQSLLEQYQQQVNQQPLADFHGLSPEQMQRLLYHPFDSPEVVEFPPILAEDPIGPLAELFSLLAAAIGTEGLKPTATGNLPRKVCREIALAHMGERQYAKYTEYRGINSEPDFSELATARFTAEAAGLIRKYKGRFILSRKCRELMDKDGMRAVYQLLFRSYVRRVEWSAMDGYPQLGFLQDSFVFTLHLINVFGDQWRHNSFYVTEFLKAFPSLLGEIPADTYSTPIEMLSSMYTIRCLERFACYTGVAELKVTPSDVRMRDFKLRKGPLFDQIVKFHT